MTTEKSSTVEVGVVLSKRGKVTGARNGEVRILKRGDAIYSDDVVATVRGANLQLKMHDTNIIMLRGGSSFKVALYRFGEVEGNAKRFEYSSGVLKPSQRHFAHDTNVFSFGANG